MIFTRSTIKEIDLSLEIQNKTGMGKIDELLLVVPTNRKNRYLKREIITASPGGSAAGINMETLGTFAQKMIAQTDVSSGRILNDAASAVLLKKSFIENKLRYFSNYKDNIPAGTLERIKNVLNEYKRHGITSELLRQESGGLNGSEKLKALDIADIYDSYNTLCMKLNVKEIGDVYKSLNNLSTAHFQSSFRSLYPNVNLVIINGFDEFTTPEIDLITSASSIPGLDLFLQLDYYGLNESIFSHLDKCYAKLLSNNFLIVEDRGKEELNDFKSQIREKLFLSGKQKNEGYELTRIEAPSREKEVEFIAKEIKELINSGKTEPDKICVVFNLIKNYSPVVRDIFPMYGLPFNLTDRKALSLSAPVITIINFLEILENDYYYKNIFRALSSGYIKLNNLNLSNLYSASVKLKIISGYTNWETSLNQEINRLEKDTENGRSSSIKIYIKALEDIQTLHRVLSSFNRKMTVKEFRSLLTKTIFDLNIHSEILNNSLDNIEENIKGLTEFLNMLDELFELLEMEEGNKKLSLKYFLNNIRTAVSGTRFNIKEKPGYGVLVTNLNEIRGLNFEYLFIGGLCDGDLPTRYTPEIFYSGRYAKNEKNHQTEERYHFYQSLCSWQKKLFLSYPLINEKKEVVKSNLLNEFEDLFILKTKNEQDYSSKIYSNEELLYLLGTGKTLKEELSGESVKRITEYVHINNQRKNDPFGESEYSGRILNSLDLVSRQALEDFCKKEFSVSQLEIYAGCPFRYFAERVLNLNTVEEPSEEIERKEIGSLLHSILYRFYTEINKTGIILSNADDDCFNTAVKLLFSIAEEEIASASFSPLSFYEKEKILGINGKQQESILYRFLQLEREQDDGYRPAFFEISFGDFPQEKSDGGEVLKNFKAGNVKVRGKIDRIDINDSEELFKVVDYKSGAARPVEKEISLGLSLQVPLYIIAARELIKLKLGKNYNNAGGEIFSLKYAEKNLGKSLVVKDSKEMAEACIATIEKYVKSIAAGNFNLSELPDRETKVCRFCSYRSVCRIDDLG